MAIKFVYCSDTKIDLGLFPEFPTRLHQVLEENRMKREVVHALDEFAYSQEFFTEDDPFPEGK